MGMFGPFWTFGIPKVHFLPTSLCCVFFGGVGGSWVAFLKDEVMSSWLSPLEDLGEDEPIFTCLFFQKGGWKSHQKKAVFSFAIFFSDSKI